ncbi:MAG TPA: hypothetical protein PLB35_03505 [Myxococcota bacterium]|nr:hypothetical protein [Myxococcota bacterium]HOH76297.1 hypothetical protein [Myxococcota bacterium]
MKSLLKYVAAAVLFAGLYVPGALALDAVPHGINIQGVLRNVGGEVVTGTYSVKFTIYDAIGGGAVLCQNITSISVTGGVFNTSVTCPATAFVNRTAAYLGIQVGSDAELARIPLTSVGFAIQAEHAEQADELLGAATDVNCVGCIGDNEVSFPYAGSTTRGGPATDVNCNGCVSGGAPGDIAAGSITTNNIGAGQVQNGNIADGAISNSKLGANSVKTGNIEDGQVTTNDLATGAVTTVKIGTGAVGDTQLGVNYALGTSKGGPAADLNCSGPCVSDLEAGFNYALGTTKGGPSANLDCLAIPGGCVEAGEVSFQYAAGATKGGAAVDLACTDCVGSGEVQFNYAGSTSEGGPASDVACTNCIASTEVNFNYANSTSRGGDATGLACGSACVSTNEVDFNWAASATKGGPANDLLCVGCVDSGDISDGTIVNADITGPITGSKITTATTTDLGVVKIGSGIAISSGSITPDWTQVAQKDHNHGDQYFEQGIDHLTLGDGKYIDFLDGSDNPGSYPARLQEVSTGGDGNAQIRLSLGQAAAGSGSYFEIEGTGAYTGARHRLFANGNAYHAGSVQMDGALSCTGCVDTTDIADGTVTTNDIYDGTITGADLNPALQLTTTGKVTAGEVWAQKFVDVTGSPNWYADPQATSVMNTINASNFQLRTNNYYGLKTNGGGTMSLYTSSIDAANGETLYIAKNACGLIDVYGTTCGSNIMTIHGTLKAKSLVDEDSGAYVVDPASHSKIATLETNTVQLPATGTTTNYINGTTYAFDTQWNDGATGYYLDPSSASYFNVHYGNSFRTTGSWQGDPPNGYGQFASSGTNLYISPAPNGSAFVLMRFAGNDRMVFSLNGNVSAGIPSFRTNGGYLVINSGSTDKRLLLNWDQSGGTTEVVGTFKAPSMVDSVSPTCVMDAGNTSNAYEIYSQYISTYYLRVHQGLRIDGTNGLFVVGNGDWGTGIRMYGNTSIIPHTDGQGAVGMSGKRFAFMYSINSVWTSNRELKKDIRYLNKRDMDSIGKALQQIKPATFLYNHEVAAAEANESTDKMFIRNVPHIGLILDEMPEIITNGGDGWYANDSVGFLLVASKYLDDKINRQAETIRDLEDRIAIMEQAIADAGLFN